MKVQIERRSPIPNTPRVRQLEALFDVPITSESVLSWSGDVELPDEWQIGLIVGPSGAGKSTVAGELFEDVSDLVWTDKPVIDDFDTRLSMTEISEICSAVGFNTIPAWMRPYEVLSTGEKFRVDVARRLAEAPDDGVVVVDEFTSVVDRQVAQVGSHAIQRFVRRHAGLRFVGVTVHYDVIDWLQPDWVLHMPDLRLERRDLQQRPPLVVSISRVPGSAWTLFAPFHYLTADLNKSSKCYVLFVHDANDNLRPAAICCTLHRPHAHVDDIEGISRIVTLPDWQGLGLAFVLADTLGSAFSALGKRFHNYPAHPPFIRAHDRSLNWALVKRPGQYSPRKGDSATISGKFGGRPCAVFRYVGETMDKEQAKLLITGGK
jgi:ABC-type ATPase involved in cell division